MLHYPRRRSGVALSAVVLATCALSLSPALGAVAQASPTPGLPAHLDVTPPGMAQAAETTPVSASSPWSFGLILPSQNASGLAADAQAVSNPSSPNYGQFLTASQVAAQYGPSPALVSQLESYLGQRSFITSLSGQILQVSGTVAQVNALFGTTLVEEPTRAAPPGPPQPVGPGGHGRGHQGGGQVGPFRVAPASALTIPAELQNAVDITGLTRGDVTPLSTDVVLSSASQVQYVATADMPSVPPGNTATASNGPLTVTATPLDKGAPVAPGLAYHWLFTVTLNGQPDPSAALVALSGNFQGAPGFVDSTVTNTAGQFVVDITVSQAQQVRLDAEVTSDANPADASATTVTVALPAAHFSGPSIDTCPIGANGASVICPFNPAYNSLNTAYDASSLAAVPAAKGAPTVAVFSATSETGISTQDVNAFASTFGLPAPSVTLAYRDAGACPSIGACQSAGYEQEMSLDLQMIETSAPGANILVYASGSLRQALNEVDVQDRAKVFSISYGAGEIAEYDATPQAQAGWDLLAELANIEGITVTVAAGDSGAYEGAQFGLDQPMPSYPSNSPYVSALGATETAASPSGGILESALWGGNLGAELDTPTLLSFLSEENMMGGGGISQLESEPFYQAQAARESGRVNPDFSFDGSVVTPGILAFYGGSANEQLYLFGGTSADAPLFAGWVADLDESLGVSLGNVNPAIYALSRDTGGIVMPVAYGNNGVYSVSGGLNPVTGLGTLDMGRLATALAGIAGHTSSGH